MKEFVNKFRFTEDQRSLVIPIELGQAIMLGDKRGIRILCDAFHHQNISPSDREYLETLENPSVKTWSWGCDHNGNDQEWEDVKDTMSPRNDVPDYRKEFKDFLDMDVDEASNKDRKF